MQRRSSGMAAAALALLLQAACAPRSDADGARAAVARYLSLLRDGYQRQNMAFVAEAAVPGQVERLHHHMSALAEGGLRMSANLRHLQVVRIDLPTADEAAVETRETWDFTHYQIATGGKFAEERGFVYRMAYRVRREEGRWRVAEASVLSGEATETPAPWPAVDRDGRARRPPPSGASAPPPSPR